MLSVFARLVAMTAELLKDKRVRLLVLAAVTAVALFTFTNSYDYNVFRHWIIASEVLGVLDIYDARLIFGHVYRVVYPPLAPLLFITSVYPLLLLNPRTFLLPYPNLLVRILAKTPIVLSVLGGYYVLERRAGEKASKLLVTNPVLLFLLTAYFFDIPAAIAAAAALLYIDAPLVAGAALAVATLLKQVFAVLALPAILYYLARREKRKMFTFLAVYTALTAGFMLPFIVANGLNAIIEPILLFHMHRPPQGASLWTIVLVESGYNARLAIHVSKLWLPMFIALAALAFYRGRRALRDRSGVLLVSAAMLAALLASSKVVNPQYLAWLLPFIAAIVSLGLADERLIVLFNVAGIAAILYPTLLPYAAAVIHAPVYLEEEMRWLTPQQVEKLVIDAAPELAPRLISLARGNPLLYAILYTIYHEWRIVEPVLSITYTLSMLAIYYMLLQALTEYWRGGTQS